MKRIIIFAIAFLSLAANQASATQLTPGIYSFSDLNITYFAAVKSYANNQIQIVAVKNPFRFEWSESLANIEIGDLYDCNTSSLCSRNAKNETKTLNVLSATDAIWNYELHVPKIFKTKVYKANVTLKRVSEQDFDLIKAEAIATLAGAISGLQTLKQSLVNNCLWNVTLSQKTTNIELKDAYFGKDCARQEVEVANSQTPRSGLNLDANYLIDNIYYDLSFVLTRYVSPQYRAHPDCLICDFTSNGLTGTFVRPSHFFARIDSGNSNDSSAASVRDLQQRMAMLNLLSYSRLAQ